MTQAIFFIIGLYLGHCIMSVILMAYWSIKYGSHDEVIMNVPTEIYIRTTYTTPAYLFKVADNIKKAKLEKLNEDKEINEYLTKDLQGDN